nr:general transcription and DNA repair factor IIH helicase subunit [Paratrimastix eleionoma]
MKFEIQGVPISFPYPFIYPEQYHYMVKLKEAIEAHGHCLLEMPSGTGKTAALLSLILSMQQNWYATKDRRLSSGDQNSSAGSCAIQTRLIYLTRTVHEVQKVLGECKRVYAGLEQFYEGALPHSLVCIGLSSRSNLCIHPRVSNMRTASEVDSKCRDLTSSWTRKRVLQQQTTTTTSGKESIPDIELCPFFEEFDRNGRELRLPSGIYTLEDLRSFGKSKGICPYFLARQNVAFADVLIGCYPYLLDPKVAGVVGINLRAGDIVVFDEAHNIDDTCIEALSVSITRQTMDGCTQNIQELSRELMKSKTTDSKKLQDEYHRMVDDLSQHWAGRGGEQLISNPVLTKDVMEEAVPGNIRKAEHFLGFLKRFMEYIKLRLRSQVAANESPLAFRQHLYTSTQIPEKPLRFLADRLQALLRTLEIQDIARFTPLINLTNLGVLAGTYTEGFSVIIETGSNGQIAAGSSSTPLPPSISTSTYSRGPCLRFCCHDASLAMQPVFAKADSVVITSGTLSPLSMYPKILSFVPVVCESLPMSLARECVCPLIVTRGSDQLPVSSKYDVRNDPSVVRNYGALLVEISGVAPDGVVAFFPSYQYLSDIVASWHDMGLLNQVLQSKLLFIETQDLIETGLALSNYRRACDSGRGAVFLCVARGKVSEGIDFEGQYGRAVIAFGVPYMYTESLVLKARLDFLRTKYGIREAEFLTFDAIRTSAQCIGRVLRSKSDYGTMIFADKRFALQDKRSKLPGWLREHLTDARTNLSTDMAIGLCRQYYKEMAQEIPWESQLGRAWWDEEHVRKAERQATSSQPTAHQIKTDDSKPP